MQCKSQQAAAGDDQMAFGTDESADKKINQESLEALPDEESCNSAICLDCALKYYEYIAESGEIVLNCVMCA